MQMTKGLNSTSTAHTRATRQVVGTSLSTYLNKVTATNIISIMNSIMEARSRTVPTMALHMVPIRVRMVDLDRAKDMDMVTGMDMVVRASKDWMMRRR